MTHKHFSSSFLKIGIPLLAVFLLFTGMASAGSIFIDTAGLTGTVNEPIQVPVKVTDPNNIFAFQLTCGIGETADYKITFYEGDDIENDLSKYTYGKETGIVATVLGFKNVITEDKVLFYLEVTPKTAKPIELTLTDVIVQELRPNNDTPEVKYTVRGATLTVEGGTTPTDKPTDTPTDTPTVTPSVTPSPTTTPSGGSSGGSTSQPSVIPTTTPTQTETGPTPPTSTESVPTFTPQETHVADINNDGSADFAQSQIIFSVTLPEDHPGTVELTTNIDASDIEALAGKEIYHAAEISLDHPLAPGETATVHFMIPIAELERRGLTAADVCLYHHDHDGLTALPTVYEVIGNTVYYESTATEFSPFIIVFEENGATPSTEPVKTPAPTETPKSTGFGVLGVLAGLGVFAVLKRK